MFQNSFVFSSSWLTIAKFYFAKRLMFVLNDQKEFGIWREKQRFPN
jgi:hypothetical protein